MPTYQYACTNCGHHIETVQSFADEPLTECPACEGKLRKIFSSVGIVFKGSGFYRTDSRSGSESGKESDSNGTAAKKDGGDTSGSSSASSSGSASSATSGSSANGSSANSSTSSSSSKTASTA